ncbi:MAG: flagellar hook-length control protein FliK [Acidithiobacillus sp.]|nr:flagellar hook-length control protein FliK [Acidithiobacillus sp.]
MTENISGLSILSPFGGEKLPLPSISSGLSLLAPGSEISAQIVQRDGEQAVLQMMDQAFSIKLPPGLPANTRSLSLLYLGGGANPRFLYLPTEDTLSAANALQLSTLSLELLVGANSQNPAPVLRLGPFSTMQEPAQFAAELQNAMQKSGLSYESHLLAWAQGQFSKEALLSPFGGEKLPLPSISSGLSLLAPGSQISAQIVQREGEQAVLQMMDQAFSIKLPPGLPANTRSLSLLYLGGGANPRFLYLPTEDTLSAANALQLSTLSRELLVGANSQNPAPVLRLGPLSTMQEPTQFAAELQNMVQKSGLFYESHLLAWAQGQFSKEALLQEPQGSQSMRQASPGGNLPPVSPSQVPAQNIGSLQQQALASYGSIATQTGNSFQSVAMPKELASIVQQQGQILLHQQCSFAIEAWPGQNIHWILHRQHAEKENDDQHSSNSLEYSENQWESRLEMELPRLGRCDAHLRLRGRSLDLRLEVQNPGHFQIALASLQEALCRCGLDVKITVQSHGS